MCRELFNAQKFRRKFFTPVTALRFGCTTYQVYYGPTRMAGSQDDIIQREEKTLGVNIGPDKRGKPILNRKNTTYKRLQTCSFYEKLGSRLQGGGRRTPALNELKEAQKEVYKGQRSIENEDKGIF